MGKHDISTSHMGTEGLGFGEDQVQVEDRSFEGPCNSCHVRFEITYN
jgi:hypothetical protein